MVDTFIIKSLLHSLECSIPSEVYAICYKNNNDKRILINYGIFYNKEDCKDYINTIKINKNKLFVYPIELNINIYKDVIAKINPKLQLIYDNLRYCNRLEHIVYQDIIQDIKTLEPLYKNKYIIDKICLNYDLTEQELCDMIPELYDKLILEEKIDFDKY